MPAPVLVFTKSTNQSAKPESALMKKIAKLEIEHPRGAAVIEKLVDDLLSS